MNTAASWAITTTRVDTRIAAALDSASPAADKAERDRIATQVFDFASEQVLLIGTVGYAPVPVVVSNHLGNFPRDVRFAGDDAHSLRDVKPDQWYVKQ